MATIGFGHYRGVAFFPYHGDSVGTKVSGHDRQGGHSSGVAIKRDSTVDVLQGSLDLLRPLREQEHSMY